MPFIGQPYHKKIIQPSLAQLIGIAFQVNMRILFAGTLETN